MNVIRSEHNWPHRSLPWLMAAGVLASLFLALTAIRARAADPPQPDFFWPYGKVQLDGANIFPTSQRVIGIVNGKSCGDASTLVAQAGASCRLQRIPADETVIDHRPRPLGNATATRPRRQGSPGASAPDDVRDQAAVENPPGHLTPSTAVFRWTHLATLGTCKSCGRTAIASRKARTWRAGSSQRP